MYTNIKIAILLGLLLIIYILYFNNIYLSYKIYNNDKLNDYDKFMIKTTNITQSLIFIVSILGILFMKNKYKFKLKYENDYNIFIIISVLLYYCYSLYINYNHFYNNYDLDNMNDDKNKYLRYHIYSSIPLLLLVLITAIYNNKMYK